MLVNEIYTQVSNAITQSFIDFQYKKFPFIPEKALLCKSFDYNEYCGKFYKVKFFPMEYGDEKDGSIGSYVKGYTLHDDTRSFNKMVIGSIPTMDYWKDVYNSTHGFLVTFQYAGYSELYKKVYGFYIKHEIITDDFDLCA